MKKSRLNLLFVAITIFGLTSCGSSNKNEKDTKEDTATTNTVKIELLPMYGSTPEFGNIQKTPEQQEVISDFLVSSDEKIPDRKEAAIMYLEISFHDIDNGDFDRAMERANQAWLLDPLNADIYVAFADILNAKGNQKQALEMFDRAANLAHDKVLLFEYYLNEAYIYYKASNDNTYIKKVLEYVNNLPKPEDQEMADRLAKVKEDAELYLNS